MNGDEVHIDLEEKLCLYQNGNYIGSFDTVGDIDRYLRHISQWQDPADAGGVLSRRFKKERWTVSRASFISYRENAGE